MYISYTLYQADSHQDRAAAAGGRHPGRRAGGGVRAAVAVAGAASGPGQRGFRQAPEIEMLTEARAGCSVRHRAETVCR